MLEHSIFINSEVIPTQSLLPPSTPLTSDLIKPKNHKGWLKCTTSHQLPCVVLHLHRILKPCEPYQIPLHHYSHHQCHSSHQYSRVAPSKKVYNTSEVWLPGVVEGVAEYVAYWLKEWSGLGTMTARELLQAIIWRSMQKQVRIQETICISSILLKSNTALFLSISTFTPWPRPLEHVEQYCTSLPDSSDQIHTYTGEAEGNIPDFRLHLTTGERSSWG